MTHTRTGVPDESLSSSGMPTASLASRRNSLRGTACGPLPFRSPNPSAADTVTWNRSGATRPASARSRPGTSCPLPCRYAIVDAPWRVSSENPPAAVSA